MKTSAPYIFADRPVWRQQSLPTPALDCSRVRTNGQHGKEYRKATNKQIKTHTHTQEYTYSSTQRLQNHLRQQSPFKVLSGTNTFFVAICFLVFVLHQYFLFWSGLMASCCGHLTRPHAWAYPGYRLVPVAKVHVAAPGRQVLRQVIDHVESQLAFFNFAYPYPVYSFLAVCSPSWSSCKEAGCTVTLATG